jgi:Flp pilus assembly protein TadB
VGVTTDTQVRRRAVRHRRTAERAASYERAVHRERVAARRSRRLRGEEVSERLRVHAEQTTADRRPKTRRPSSRTFLGIAVLGALLAVFALRLTGDGRVDPDLVFVAAVVTGVLAWLIRYGAHRRRTGRDRHPSR